MSPGGVISGRVTQIVDGDTIVVKTDKGRRRVDLAGVDAPESNPTIKLRHDAARAGLPFNQVQRWGLAAARFTRQLVYGREVRVSVIPGRRPAARNWLGYVRLADGRDLASELLGAGWSLATRLDPHPARARYLDLEARARAGRRGLWADPAWRKYAAMVTPMTGDTFEAGPGRR